MKTTIFSILILLIPLKKTHSIEFFDSKKIISLSPETARIKSHQQLMAINLKSSHTLTKGKGVLIAIIDTGVNINHSSLKNNVWLNRDEIPNNGHDDDNNGHIDDMNGWNFFDDNNIVLDGNYHGTASASVVASSSSGVAPQSKIIALRVTSSNGGTTRKDIFKAMKYAMEAGAHIINLSFQRFKYEDLDLEDFKILKLLEEKQVLVVMSAGNRSSECSYNGPMRPLPYKNILSVVATTLNSMSPSLTTYSNFGNCYTVAAPAGVRISESQNKFDWGIVSAYGRDNKSYYLYNGTSAAAPVVAGTLALALSMAPNIGAIKMKEVLIKSARFQQNLLQRVYTSSIIDAYKTIQNAVNLNIDSGINETNVKNKELNL